MNQVMKSCVLCSVLLFVLLNNAGIIDGTNTFPSHHKIRGHANSRKVLELNIVLDYDYAGPNPKHEPRGRKGGGSKNP